MARRKNEPVEPSPESLELLYKRNCPKCQEDWPDAKGFAVYGDGHGYCFVCSYRAPMGTFLEEHDGGAYSGHGVGLNAKATKVTTPSDFLSPEDREDAWKELSDRKIRSETMRKFGYFRGNFGKDRTGVHVWTLYDQTGTPNVQRLRFPDKSFTKIGQGNPIQGWLFGQQIWGEKSDRRIIITEGELDAMSVAQATDFKYPVVSVNGGADSAKKCLQANWKYLDRYDEIILWFDRDEAHEKPDGTVFYPGQDAVQECAPLFAHGKVKVVTTVQAKDANELLMANKPGDISAAIFAATTWSPVGILNAADLADDVVHAEVPAWNYPWPGLQEFTKGARRGEVAYDVAGTGVGKTTILFEKYHHFRFGTGHTEAPARIGWIGLEGVRRDVLLGFMSITKRRRLHLDPLPEKEMRKLHKEVFGDGWLHLFDQETADWRFTAIMGYIRYLAKACDCNIIVIDPMSFLVAQMDEADERKAIDKASAALAIAAKELNVHINISHHLRRVNGGEGKSHEEGGQTSLAQLRGSGGIANFASQVVGYERNQQAEGERGTLTAQRVLKNRFVGRNGLCDFLQYETTTGHTYAIPYEDGKALWGDEDKGRDGGPKGFSDFTGDEDF